MPGTPPHASVPASLVLTVMSTRQTRIVPGLPAQAGPRRSQCCRLSGAVVWGQLWGQRGEAPEPVLGGVPPELELGLQGAPRTRAAPLVPAGGCVG